MRPRRRRGADVPRIRRPSREPHPMTSPTVESPQAIAWTDDRRRAQFEGWLVSIAPRHGLRAETLCPASADASFRRYFRIAGARGSFIVMDAPPTHEDVTPFVHVARLARDAGLNAPAIVEQDP